MAIVCFFSTVHFLFFTIGALPVGFNQRVTKKEKKSKQIETIFFIYSNMNKLLKKSIIHLQQKHPAKMHLQEFSVYFKFFSFPVKFLN